MKLYADLKNVPEPPLVVYRIELEHRDEQGFHDPFIVSNHTWTDQTEAQAECDRLTAEWEALPPNYMGGSDFIETKFYRVVQMHFAGYLVANHYEKVAVPVRV